MDCWHRTIDFDESFCQECEDVDTEYHLEPPTNWKYEDSEGEWK